MSVTKFGLRFPNKRVVSADAREVSVAVPGLGRSYRFHVDAGHVNFKGRRLSLEYALKKSLKKIYGSGTIGIVERISERLPSETFEIDCVVQLTPEHLSERITPSSLASQIKEALAKSRNKPSLRGNESEQERLPAKEQIKRERAMMLSKLALEPITEDEQDVFDQAFESLQHESN